MDDVIWYIDQMAEEGIIDGRPATFFPLLGANGAWLIRSPVDLERVYDWKTDSLDVR